MKLRLPDLVFLTVGDGDARRELSFDGAHTLTHEDVLITLREENEALHVDLTAAQTPVRGLRLVWQIEEEEQRVGEPLRVLGDAWERGYGDLSWQSVNFEHCMPWYFAVSGGSDAERDTAHRYTELFGVEVRPEAMCLWQYDGEEVTLWLDTRCGGEGVLLGGSTVHAATVLFGNYHNCYAYDALCDFCKRMCPDPLPGGEHVYGSNNWYYAYGRSSADEIRADAALIASLAEGCAHTPYMVIDDGWQPHPVDAPWTAGNERFPDMAALAADIRAAGARPGIWIRYLIDTHHCVPLPDACRRGDNGNVFDPSHPAVLQYVRACNARITAWGYELIKHDYSTYDIFGKWGFAAPAHLADDGWHFYDRTKTTAQIIVNFYRTVLDSAPNTVILGCNCIGHLCAGLVHLNRTGDDTSGMEWARTRKMGVNTLAFRMPQNRAFYGADADCVGMMGRFPWENNRRWLQLLACSGSPLFLSIKPECLSEEQREDVHRALLWWNRVVDAGECATFRPIDWMESATPRLYEISTPTGEGTSTLRLDWAAADHTSQYHL